MFTWICPKCGGEVPPSYSDCPKCAAAAASAPVQAPPKTVQPATPQHEVPQQVPPIPPPPSVVPPVEAPPPPPPPTASAPPPYSASLPSFGNAPVRNEPAGPSRQLSPTVVAILAAVGIVGLLAILYLYVLPSRSESTTASNAPVLQTPGQAGSSQPAHPLAKHLEVGGMRISHSNGSARITFLVVNHSAADLPDLKLNMAVVPLSGGNAVFEFPVALPSIGPYESREITSTVKTNLKPYEIPDWQAVRPKFEVTSQP